MYRKSFLLHSGLRKTLVVLTIASDILGFVLQPAVASDSERSHINSNFARQTHTPVPPGNQFASAAGVLGSPMQGWGENLPDWSHVVPAAVANSAARRLPTQASAKSQSKSMPVASPLPVELSQIFAPYAEVETVRLRSPLSIGADGKIVSGASLIVHIQDAHGLYSAQKNIAFLIKKLADRGITLVGAEGAAGEMPGLKLWRHYPDRSSMLLAGRTLTKAGFLTGLELAAVSDSRIDVVGVEAARDYLAQVHAFEKTLRQSSSVQIWRKAFAKDLSRLKARIFSLGLLKFDEQKKAFDAGYKSLSLWMDFLVEQNHGEVHGHNLSIFWQARQYEKTLDVKKVQAEQSDLMQQLAKRLDAAALKQLAQEGIAYRAGRQTHAQFYSVLRGYLARAGLSPTAELNRYAAYMALTAQIDRKALWQELRAYEKEVARRLQNSSGKTAAQAQALYALSDDFNLLGKVADFRLSPDEWDLALSRQTELLNIAERAQRLAEPFSDLRVFNMPSDVRRILHQGLSFSAYSEKRNHHFIDNLFARMDKTSHDSAILVAGGYHTRGLEKILEREGVSYITLRPKMDSADLRDGSSPMEAFTDHWKPLEQAFRPEKFNISPVLRYSGAALDEKGRLPVFRQFAAVITFGLTAQGKDEKLRQSSASYLKDRGLSVRYYQKFNENGQKMALVEWQGPTGLPRVFAVALAQTRDPENRTALFDSKRAVATLDKLGFGQIAGTYVDSIATGDQADSPVLVVVELAGNSLLQAVGHGAIRAVADVKAVLGGRWTEAFTAVSAPRRVRSWKAAGVDQLRHAVLEAVGFDRLQDLLRALAEKERDERRQLQLTRQRSQLLSSAPTYTVDSGDSQRLSLTLGSSVGLTALSPSEQALADIQIRLALLPYQDYKDIPVTISDLSQAAEVALDAEKKHGGRSPASLQRQQELVAIYYVLQAGNPAAAQKVTQELRRITGHNAVSIPALADDRHLLSDIKAVEMGDARASAAAAAGHDGLDSIYDSFAQKVGRVLFLTQDVWNEAFIRASDVRAAHPKTAQVFVVTDIIEQREGWQDTLKQVQSYLQSATAESLARTVFVSESGEDVKVRQTLSERVSQGRPGLAEKLAQVPAHQIFVRPAVNIDEIYEQTFNRPALLLVYANDPYTLSRNVESFGNIVVLDIVDGESVRTFYSASELTARTRRLFEQSA